MDPYSQHLLGSQWRAAAAQLGVNAISPFRLELPDSSGFDFACLLPQFGGDRGMLLSTEYNKAAFTFAMQDGYGLSTMSAETAPEHLDNLESYAECLRDWGWNYDFGNPPDWYASEPQHAG